MSVHRYGRQPKTAPSEARRFFSHLDRSYNYVEGGDSGAALLHMRIAAEVYGRLLAAVDAAGPSGRRLEALSKDLGERLLALEGAFSRRFLDRGPPRRSPWWRRIFYSSEMG